jgi:hypothetical protein
MEENPGRKWKKMCLTAGNIYGRFPKWIRHSAKYELVPSIGLNIARLQMYSL